jgi:hypothetical protein
MGCQHDRSGAGPECSCRFSRRSEDEKFCGRPPFNRGQARIEGKPDIQEICVAGDFAFCWNQLFLTVTPLQGGPAQRRAGPTLSVFRKEPDGRWILFRDANMLKAV